MQQAFGNGMSGMVGIPGQQVSYSLWFYTEVHKQADSVGSQSLVSGFQENSKLYISVFE